jgi:hypothetical protein
MGMDELVDQAGLPHTRFPDHGHQLPVTDSRAVQCLAEDL